MTLIEKYREAIVVLDSYVHNGWHGDTESDAIGFFFELEEKIIPKFSKGEIVRFRSTSTLPKATYEVERVMFNFEDEQEYCHIMSKHSSLVAKSSTLERIE